MNEKKSPTNRREAQDRKKSRSSLLLKKAENYLSVALCLKSHIFFFLFWWFANLKWNFIMGYLDDPFQVPSPQGLCSLDSMPQRLFTLWEK